jgi:hypothetical protein
MILAMILAPAFGNSSQERPRSLSGPLLPGPETRSLLRGCRYVSRPQGALKRETGASFKSLCFSWRTVKAFSAPRERVKSPLFAILLATGWLYARIDRCQVVRSRKRPG